MNQNTWLAIAFFIVYLIAFLNGVRDKNFKYRYISLAVTLTAYGLSLYFSEFFSKCFGSLV